MPNLHRNIKRNSTSKSKLWIHNSKQMKQIHRCHKFFVNCNWSQLPRIIRYLLHVSKHLIYRWDTEKLRYIVSLLNGIIFSDSIFPKGYACLEFNYDIYIRYILDNYIDRKLYLLEALATQCILCLIFGFYQSKTQSFISVLQGKNFAVGAALMLWASSCHHSKISNATTFSREKSFLSAV